MKSAQIQAFNFEEKMLSFWFDFLEMQDACS